MKILASKSILVALALMLGLSFAAQAQSGAEATYKAKCAMCHGAEGKGDSPMVKKLNVRDLGSPEVQKQSDAELTTIVTKGKGKMMPFEGKLTADQIGQLVAYIRELGKKK